MPRISYVLIADCLMFGLVLVLGLMGWVMF